MSESARETPLLYYAALRFWALVSLLQCGFVILSRTLSFSWDIVATPFGGVLIEWSVVSMDMIIRIVSTIVAVIHIGPQEVGMSGQ